jgi:hypothetical protein
VQRDCSLFVTNAGYYHAFLVSAYKQSTYLIHAWSKTGDLFLAPFSTVLFHLVSSHKDSYVT